MSWGPEKMLIRCSKESHHPAEWVSGPPVEHLENEKDTTLTAIRVGVKIFQLLFGLQLPLTRKHWITFSNPCNKVRGTYLLKKSSCVFIIVSLWYCRWQYNNPSWCNIAMIRICERYIMHKMFIRNRNPKKTKHWRLSWFRYETLITFFKFRFSTRGERETLFFYADCSSIVSSQFTDPTNTRAHPAVHKVHWPRPGPKHQLASSKYKSQLTAFIQNHQESQPIASGHDVIHIPSVISYLGFLLWHLWLSHPPRARMNTCVNVCTYPCTKPKGSKPN